MNNAIFKGVDRKFDKRCIERLGDMEDEKREWIIKSRNFLRLHATESEILVAEDLLRRRIKYYTQVPLFFQDVKKVVFLDFFLPKGKIVFEIDGGYHNKTKQKTEDLIRDSCLKQLGFTVVRFSNEEIGGERYEAVCQCFRKKYDNTRKAVRKILRDEQKGKNILHKEEC